MTSETDLKGLCGGFLLSGRACQMATKAPAAASVQQAFVAASKPRIYYAVLLTGCRLDCHCWPLATDH